MQKSEGSENLIYKKEVFNDVLPFLKLNEVLSTATLSKEWSYNLNHYIKKVVLPENLENLNQNALATLKMFYNRKVQIFQNGNLIPVQIPFIVDKISVGNLVTCLKLIDGTFVLGYTSKLQHYESKDWKDDKKVVKLGNKYNDIRCIGDYVYCIKNQQIVRYEPSQDKLLSGEQILNFNSLISRFDCSFNFGLIILGEKAQFKVFSHKEFKPINIQISKDIQNIHELRLFQNNLIFCSGGIIYEIKIDTPNNKITQIKSLKGKYISKVVHGYRHCFAFERKTKLIEELNNAQVLKWIENEGFDDYLKIFKNEKVTGKKLLEMEKGYMEDVLGITNYKIQQRMKVRIHQCNEENPQQYTVYAWGRNDKGQLCTNPSANVTNPVKVKLPENCIIQKCLGDKTVITNMKTEELMMNSHEGNKLKWESLSKSKVWSMDNIKSEKIILASSVGVEKIPQAFSEVPIHNKKEKLRTAKNIIDKITWDEHFKKSDFRVGYLDKFTGMLESSLEELLKSEVKEYRIMYFKCKGSVVWDKKSRIDIL